MYYLLHMTLINIKAAKIRPQTHMHPSETGLRIVPFFTQTAVQVESFKDRLIVLTASSH